ncbi:hypothetical protein [Thiohalorhabdus methylotrophus]|uniref:Uncharacterized protein n=1 Tax=Thiohalorhabdus methylotrophus TaxID=3242694 RepID=A0ABV4TRN4_9GAMM
MQRIVASMVLGASLLLALPTNSKAASYVAQDVWYSTLYGAAVGGVAGTGVMLLTDDPLKHTDYVVSGVGIGILSGLFYGIYSYAATPSYGALANVDETGATHYSVPVPQAFTTEIGGQRETGVRVDLIRGRF